MQPRRNEVAKLAGVPVHLVLLASVEQVRQSRLNKTDPDVLEVATQEPAYYWQVGDTFYLDDPYFGPVVAFEDLRIDPELGLCDKRKFPAK